MEFEDLSDAIDKVITTSKSERGYQMAKRRLTDEIMDRHPHLLGAVLDDWCDLRRDQLVMAALPHFFSKLAEDMGGEIPKNMKIGDAVKAVHAKKRAATRRAAA